MSSVIGRETTARLFGNLPSHPRFAHLATLYYNFDWSGPAEMAREAAGISEQALQNKTTSVFLVRVPSRALQQQ